MNADEAPGGDVFGIRPFGKAAVVLAEATVQGAGAFLGRICLPAAEEFGLLLRDKVSEFRGRNVLAVLAGTEEKLLAEGRDGVHAPPRLVSAVLEEASWVDDRVLQDKWAGLLASACTPDGRDDSNLLFIDLLRRLTAVQARILDYACLTAQKFRADHGLVYAAELELAVVPLQELAGTEDIQRLDRELDHLRSMELLRDGGFEIPHGTEAATLTPSPLALHLYVRCKGSQLSPVEYFGLTE